MGLKEECIETAKGAIAEADGGDIGFRSYNEDKRWENLATAAFAAIMERLKECGEDVFSAGAKAFVFPSSDAPGSVSVQESTKRTWQAMLAAAAE